MTCGEEMPLPVAMLESVLPYCMISSSSCCTSLGSKWYRLGLIYCFHVCRCELGGTVYPPERHCINYEGGELRGCIAGLLNGAAGLVTHVRG